jgi:hypothetical protein
VVEARNDRYSPPLPGTAANIEFGSACSSVSGSSPDERRSSSFPGRRSKCFESASTLDAGMRPVSSLGSLATSLQRERSEGGRNGASTSAAPVDPHLLCSGAGDALDICGGGSFLTDTNGHTRFTLRSGGVHEQPRCTPADAEQGNLDGVHRRWGWGEVGSEPLDGATALAVGMGDGRSSSSIGSGASRIDLLTARVGQHLKPLEYGGKVVFGAPDQCLSPLKHRTAALTVEAGGSQPLRSPGPFCASPGTPSGALDHCLSPLEHRTATLTVEAGGSQPLRSPGPFCASPGISVSPRHQSSRSTPPSRASASSEAHLEGALHSTACPESHGRCSATSPRPPSTNSVRTRAEHATMAQCRAHTHLTQTQSSGSLQHGLETRLAPDRFHMGYSRGRLDSRRPDQARLDPSSRQLRVRPLVSAPFTRSQMLAMAARPDPARLRGSGTLWHDKQ